MAFALLVAGGNALAAYRFAVRMQDPPLMVDRALLDLRQLDARPEIKSVNMRIPDFWARLWANSFLLRKPQYFLTHTYEGRRNTALKGEWDLTSSVLRIVLPEARDQVVVNGIYALVDTRSRSFLRARLGDGWYDAESTHRPPSRWHWTKGDAEIVLENPHAYPLRLLCRFDARSLVPRDLQVVLDGRLVATMQLGLTRQNVRGPEFVLPPGGTRLQLRSSVPPSAAGGSDPRLLGFAAYAITLEVRPDSKAP
jgi:hypothetical protein